MLLILIPITHCLIAVFGNSICPEPVIDGESEKQIYSPEFPLVRPPGPYTCLYHLQSQNKDVHVKLIFDDFLSVCSINEPECDNKDLLKIYDGANSSFPLLGEFMLASNKRPPALLSSDNEMFIEYIVVSIHNNFEFSAFKANYRFIPPNTPNQPTNVQTFLTFQKEEELIDFQIGTDEGGIDIVWLIKVELTNMILNLNMNSNTSLSTQAAKVRLTLEVLDGFMSTSNRIKLADLSSAGFYTTLDLRSTNRTLYIRLFSASINSFDGLKDAVFSIYMYNEQEKCRGIECTNGGKCHVSPFYPIGKLLCKCFEGYYRTSCENISTECPLNYCFNGGTCFRSIESFYCVCPPLYTGDLCFQRVTEEEKQGCGASPCANGGTCQLSQSGVVCQCPVGFVGDRCEILDVCYDNSFCANGGTCQDTIHATPFCLCTDEYYGNNCEYSRIKDEPVVSSECPPNYCFNGGTCFHSHDEFYCVCPPLYSGKFCFLKVIEETNSKSKYFITLIIIPVILFFMIYLIYKFKKKRHDSQPNQNSDHRTDLYLDHPPSYEQTMSSCQQSTVTDPPPKVEDALIATETNLNTENTPSQNLENRSTQPEEQTRMLSGLK